MNILFPLATQLKAKRRPVPAAVRIAAEVILKRDAPPAEYPPIVGSPIILPVH
jgi:hypothetical protein